jgi:hypothetical protein
MADDPLVVARFIETTELLRVQRPKNIIKEVGDYLRADVPFEGKNDNFDPFLRPRDSAVFDCAVALCTMKNALWVISYLI